MDDATHKEPARIVNIGAALLKFAAVALLVAFQVAMISVLNFIWVAAGAAAGTALLTAARRMRRGTASWLMKAAGITCWLAPAGLALFFETMFVSLFEIKGIVLLVSFGAAGVLLLSSGSYAIYAILALPLLYMLIYHGLAPCAAAGCAIAVCAGAMLRKKRLRLSVPARFASGLIYGSVLYSAVWYSWPDMIHPIDTGGDPAIRHLEPVERVAARSQFPRSFYAVREGCDGETLYIINQFNSPGILEWRRGQNEVTAHREIAGAAEDLIFDCEAGTIRAAEYRTGKLFVCRGGFDGVCDTLPANVLKPNRIYHHPKSNYYFYGGDEASFPWHIVNGKGELLHKFEIGAVVELVSLPDDSFVVSYKGRVRIMRFDEKKHSLATARSARLPDPRFHYWRIGPLFQNLQYDEINGFIYISDFNTAEIYRVRLADMKISTLAKLDRGIRYIVFVPKRNMLAVGNYVTGLLSVVDAGSGKVVYEKRIGSRLRRVSASRDGDRVYAVSRGGIFEIDLNKLELPSKKQNQK